MGNKNKVSQPESKTFGYQNRLYLDRRFIITIRWMNY